MQMQAQLVQIQGITFAAKGGSNHWLTIDGPEEFGGSEAASRPKELLLFSLASCTSADIVSILHKMRVKLDRYEVNIQAEVADKHPKVIKKIHLSFMFTGKDLKEKNIERAIELSRTTYCGVWATLRDAVEITYSYEIQEGG